jgi:hypothetical protein
MSADIEKQSLETHVELCALRYAQLENRLTSIEDKVGKLGEAILESKNSMTKVLIGTAGTVIAGVLSTLVIILMKAT